jgi:DNA-binding HxlR family transcriptional regulator
MSEARLELRLLVSKQHVVEVLDVLAAGPMTAAQLSAALPRGRRRLTSALRELVISGLVTGDIPGTRDGVAPANERYQHTERGRVILGLLSNFSVWNSLYDE